VIDVANVRDARVLQMVCSEKPGPARAEDGNVEILGDRISWHGRQMRIAFIHLGEAALGPLILVRRFANDALVALLTVFFPKRRNVDRFVSRRVRRLAGHSYLPIVTTPGAGGRGYFLGSSISAFAVAITPES
jgi:hypothetical protein